MFGVINLRNLFVFLSFINKTINKMKSRKLIVAIGAIMLFLSCATNPFTGKKTMALVPNNQLFPTAFAQYDQFLSENKVVKGTKDAEMITRVGQRIAVAAERWLDANGHQGYLKDYKWDYNLVQDKLLMLGVCQEERLFFTLGFFQ